MALKITKCLLDKSNPYVIGDTTVGDKIAATGRLRYWAQREYKRIDTVVIHYISAVEVDRNNLFDLGKILDILCTCGVSAHYLINRKGGIYRLVPEKKKAWHCGPSRMPLPDNRLGVNDFSIGIELMGAAHRKFTKPQYLALRDLCLDIEARYKREMTYVGHEEIAGARAVEMGLRKEPKCDPGPRFSWDLFEKLLRGTSDGIDPMANAQAEFDESEADKEQAVIAEPIASVVVPPEQEPVVMTESTPVVSECESISEPPPVEPEYELTREPTPVVPEFELTREPTPVVPEFELTREPPPVEPEFELTREPPPVVPEFELTREPPPVVPEFELTREPTPVVPEFELTREPTPVVPEFELTREPTL